MKFFFVLILFCFFSLLPTHSAGRGMWVWDTESLLSDPPAQKELFAFGKFPPLGGEPISTLYFCTDLSREGLTPKIRSFLREAHRQGFRVEFLTGDSNWAWDRAEDGKRAVDQFLKFQQTGDSAELFDGIQLDVEPHDNPRWNYREKESGENARAMGKLLNLYRYTQTGVDRVERERGVSIKTGAAIPDWWEGGITDHRPIQETLDYVALMSYHDNAKTTLNAIESERSHAASLGKEVVVGAETLDLGERGKTLTFNEEGIDKMEEELGVIKSDIGNDPGFGGIGIHYYSAYRQRSDFDRELFADPNHLDREILANEKILAEKRATLRKISFIFFNKKKKLMSEISQTERKIRSLLQARKRLDYLASNGWQVGGTSRDTLLGLAQSQNRAYRGYVSARNGGDPALIAQREKEFAATKIAFRDQVRMAMTENPVHQKSELQFAHEELVRAEKEFALSDSTEKSQSLLNRIKTLKIRFEKLKTKH